MTPATPDPDRLDHGEPDVLRRLREHVDWNTGINLPILFRGSWKLQPSLGISNTTGGPFMLRNRNTNGDWVHQGKRFRIGATSTPTLFAFFPGIGPLQRIRHSLLPGDLVQLRAGRRCSRRSSRAPPRNRDRSLDSAALARQALQVGLSQSFEGKRKPEGQDTSSADAPKLRVLSISTSPMTYDFEQAKQPGRTGWATRGADQSFLSDMLPGFSLTLSHDLWRGEVGLDTSDFDPFLQRVDASFSISGNTFRSLGALFGIGKAPDQAARERDQEIPRYVAESGRRTRPGSFYSTNQAPIRGGGRAFSASFQYSLTRARPIPGRVQQDDQSLNLTTNFSPTPFWGLSWSTQYSITDGTFESQVVRLERDLHEWRAGFNFVRNRHGNVCDLLLDLPDRSAGPEVRLRPDDVRGIVCPIAWTGGRVRPYTAVGPCRLYRGGGGLQRYRPTP